MPRPLRPSPIVVVFCCLTGASLARGAEAATAGGPFHLYVGRQVWVQHEDGLAEVARFGTNTAEVRAADGSLLTLPIRALASLHLKPQVKLAARLVTVDALQGEPAFSSTVGGALEQASRQMDLAVQAEVELRNQEWTLGSLTASRAVAGATPDVLASLANAEQAVMANVSELAARAQHDLVNPAYQSLAASEDGPKYDAVKVSCLVSSAESLTGAYGVWVFEIVDPRTPYGTRTAARVRPLPMIGPEPQRVQLWLDGFPPGFRLESVRLSVFTDAGEVATSISERRFELDRLQAHEYLITEYMALHRGATLPPAPLRAHGLSASLELSSGVSPVERLIVTVGVDGRVVAVAFDEPREELRIEPYEQALAGAVFYPELRAGRPVQGEFIGTLTDLR